MGRGRPRKQAIEGDVIEEVKPDDIDAEIEDNSEPQGGTVTTDKKSAEVQALREQLEKAEAELAEACELEYQTQRELTAKDHQQNNLNITRMIRESRPPQQMTRSRFRRAMANAEMLQKEVAKK